MGPPSSTPAETLRKLQDVTDAALAHLKLDEPTQAQLRETLYEQAERLRRLVDQLLDLSRLDSRTVEIRRARVALKPHLESVANAVAPARGDVEVYVPVELEADVDPSAIEHVVGNLITNAIRYGAPPITVTAECKDRHLRMAVEDHG